VELERRVRAFHSWPGTQFEHDGQSIKIGAAAALAETAAAAPGVILRASAAGVDVATGAGVLRLVMLQRPGGRMMGTGEFLRGYRMAVGECLPSQAGRPLVSATPFARAG
jgi:methionyl-tRNA formyltransferase